MDASTNQPATFKQVLKVDAALFVGITFLALLGVGITNYRVDSAYSYWSYMLIFLALMTTAWGSWRSKKLGLLQGGKLLYQQAILWGAALVAVAVIYRLLEAGRINVDTTGLLVLLMLTFATFVDGMLVSWKLYVVSALLLLTLLMAAYVAQFLWVILLAAVVLVGLVLIFVVWKIRHYSNP
jgi:cation transport ATPase